MKEIEVKEFYADHCEAGDWTIHFTTRGMVVGQDQVIDALILFTGDAYLLVRSVEKWWIDSISGDGIEYIVLTFEYPIWAKNKAGLSRELL